MRCVRASASPGPARGARSRGCQGTCHRGTRTPPGGILRHLVQWWMT
jgi:hypothetical protein